MTVCRRCDGNIVQAANRLIANNPNRLKGEMTCLPEKAGVGEVRILQWNTLNKEIEGVAIGIQQLLTSGAVPDNERILVLTPRADVGRRLTAELLDLGCDDVKFHGKPKWDDPALQEALCLLTLADSLDDRVALRVWLGLGDSKWRRDGYAKVINRCVENGSSPAEVLSDEDVCKALKIPALRKRFVDLQTRLGGLTPLSRRQRLDQLLPSIGATAEIGDALRELESAADPELTASELLRDHLIATIPTTKEARVNIMTSYASKGLEAHTVIVMGLVNGLLPVKASPVSADEKRRMEEERRLMFVAVTRARSRLILSSFRKASRQENVTLRLGLVGSGPYVQTTSSRFLAELKLPAGSAITGEKWLESLEEED